MEPQAGELWEFDNGEIVEPVYVDEVYPAIAVCKVNGRQFLFFLRQWRQWVAGGALRRRN